MKDRNGGNIVWNQLYETWHSTFDRSIRLCL